MIPSVDNALRQRLWEGMTGLTLVWPNTNYTGSPPYGAVSLFWGDPQRLGVGRAVRHPGILQVTLVSQEGQGTQWAAAKAAEVRALFPMDLRIPVDVGHVRVTAPPTISGGFTDAGTWRLPVSINHETLTQGA